MGIFWLNLMLLFANVYASQSNDSQFQLINKLKDFCLVKIGTICDNIRWTTGKRLLVPRVNKCLGVQGKSVGSEVRLYDCDETSDLQRWECKNETELELQGQELFIELRADNTALLSKTTGPNSQLTISGTSSGACTRTYREFYTIEGNAAGRPCMFPFLYKNQWHSDCILSETVNNRLWCSVETKFENKTWGFCPTNVKDHWIKHPTNGAAYQLNIESALTWSQAETSCKQQSASLLSITDPHEQAYITALLEEGRNKQGYKIWTGLTLNTDHGWEWSNGNPFRYLNWDSGHPFNDPGHRCGIIDGALRFSWQSSKCDYKLGYICYSKGVLASPTEGLGVGFCSAPWIHYNTHCFQMFRTEKTWSDARIACRREGGDLASIRDVEDQSFIISQLQNASTSEPTGDEVQQSPGCKPGWNRHGSYCYYIGTEKKTFDKANDYCKRTRSSLSDVSTRMDNAFLVSLVGLRPERYFWLGLLNQKNRDVFEWTSKVPVRYTHWNSEMPGHNQGCVAMATGSSAGLWDVLPCGSRENYICKHLAEGAVVTSAPPTVPSFECADGWNKVSARNVCYKLFSGSSNRRTWFEASDYCTTIGGDLISFHSAAELLEDRGYGSVWIGLSAPDSSTGYVWSDGSPVNFQHWRDGEPNNKNNVESCVEMFIHDWNKAGSWNDNHCEKYNSWLCQIPTGVTPKPPPPPVTADYNQTSDGWLVWKGNQYYINNQAMAMEDARQFCKEKHGDLVTFNNQDENVFVWKQIYRDDNKYWIGLTVDFDRTVQWIDGSPVLFLWWADNQPDFNNFDENCVSIMGYNAEWHDYNCGFELQSICKRSGSPPANATLAPIVPTSGGCEDSWKKINSNCFKIINNQNLTWDGARQQCRDMGGNLASISSRHEQVFLISQMADRPTTDLWIGFHSAYKNGFYWTDGKSKSYVNLNLMAQSSSQHFSYLNYNRFKIRWSQRHEHLMRPAFLTWSEVSNSKAVNRREAGYTWTDWQSIAIFSHEGKCAVMNTNPSLGIGTWIPKSCNDTNGFICLKAVDPKIQDSAESKASTNYIKIANDSIKLIVQQMTWDAARKHCEADDANLVSIRTEWTQAYIELLALNLNRSLWIGLNKAKTNNYFRYIEGWHVKFTRWGNNEPRTDGNCVYVDVDGKWKTGNCNESISSVCMKSTDTPPQDESKDYPGVCPEDPDPTNPWLRYIWKPFRGFCYIFFNEAKEWTDAATSCLAHGGTLVSIADPFEQEFIRSNIETYRDRETSYWMGLFKTHKGDWMWLDKTVMDFSNWESGEPRYKSYGLIRISDGTWSTGGHWNHRPYICKTAKVLPPPLPSLSPYVKLVSKDRSRMLLAVLFIAVIAVGAGIAFAFFKNSHHRVCLPRSFPNFDNPLISNTESDLVESKNLVENID